MEQIQQLQAMIKQRLATIQYLLRIFQGQGMYFGTTTLPIQQVAKQFSNQKRKTEALFHLSMSLGLLLRITDRLEFLRATDTLFGQFEWYWNDISRTGLNRLIPRFPKRDSDTVLLDILPMPFPLDFLQTICRVLDLLHEMYARIVGGEDLSILEISARIDARCWKYVFIPIFKELDVIGNKLLDTHLAHLLNSSK
jgi:hypothetical protein